MAELTEQIRLYEPHRRQPRIAAIGGGHGLSAMLRGLKTYTKNITAIVTVADDGGGSGMLREDLGMLPPGDIRNCIMALANTEPTMQQLLNYRFTDGSLAGQSFGNLFLAAMNGISGSFDEAVHRMGDVLAITGRVLPVTNQDVRLEAEFHDGSRVLGESKIFYAKKINNSRIRKVRLVPERPAALPESVQAIRDADIVVIGPGSLYTSIIPNFLVSGISDAVRQSRACKIYALNIMTQDGETDGYDADDHVRAILEHAGPGVIDVCIANSTPVPPEIMEPYAKEGVAQLELNRTDIEQLGIAVRTFPLRDGISAIIPTRSRARSCPCGRNSERNNHRKERRCHVLFFQCQAGAVPPAHQPPAGGRGRAVRHSALLQRFYGRADPHHDRIAGSGRPAAAADEKGSRFFLRSGAGS